MLRSLIVSVFVHKRQRFQLNRLIFSFFEKYEAAKQEKALTALH